MTDFSPLIAAFTPPDRTLPAMLTRQAKRYGKRALFTAGGVTWSYAQALEIAARAGGMLTASDVMPGDRVAIMCGNRSEFMQVFLGCAWIGAVAVPINTASRGPQLQHILGNCGAKLLAAEPELLAALAHIDLTKCALTQIWTVGGTTPQEFPGIVARPMPDSGDAVAHGAIRPGQTIAILYTSGTTGPSKGVCCPQAQYFWWGVYSSHMLGVVEGDVLCTTLPLFHTNALNAFFQALLTGSTLVVEPRFSASSFWQTLIERKATVTYLLGAMVSILLARPPHPDERRHSIRSVLSPGVPAHLHAEFEARTGIKMLDGYGSTETNFVLGPMGSEARAGYMGTVCQGFEAKVVDAEDNEVPAGEPGELVVRADEPFAVSTGYFGMDDKTVEAWRNLWFHTGDRVVREADGYFRFIDRIKDAIRRRGENISSFEVEQVLLSHPEIANAAVFPVKSEMGEDEVMVALVRKGDSRLSEIELIEFCRPRLAYFAIPRYIEFMAELPATENGKIQKYKLRARGITAGTWDREASGYKLQR